MKKNQSVLLILMLTSLILCLTACEPIGYKIAQETKLADPIVTGNVYSMVPVNKTLYTQNGRIYSKSFNSTDVWTVVETPASIIGLASDAGYLYAKDSNGNVWATSTATISTASWKQVYTCSGDRAEVFLFDNGVFSNADGSTEGRNAYYRNESGVFKLQGTGSPTAETSGAPATTKNCVYAAGSDYFTDKAMVTTDGVSLFSVSSEARSDSTKECLTLVWKRPEDTEWTKITTATTSKAVTYLSMADNGALLVGTTRNYEIWTVADNKPSTGTASSDTSATIGTHSILGIWEYGNDRYASIYDTNYSTYNGLWCQTDSGTWDKQ